MTLTLGQVADWIHAEGDFDLQTQVYGYSIDSRTVGAGELFFAVQGDAVAGAQSHGRRQHEAVAEARP